ncbi:MAG TPA: hypothetical protein VN224_13195, partial [Xanthomonadales bacterium]|nr:hypothetical protein [Xanthomonadales bacterium]
SVTLSLSKGAPQPAFAADTTPQPLLVTTRYILVYVDGDKRQSASAGAGTGNYRLLGTLPDGSALVSYNDAGALAVEAISPSLASRTIKTFRNTSFIAPSNDGFLAFESASQLMRRYDLQGSIVGSPIAPLGARDALGIGDALVVLGAGRLAVWDRGGRLRREILVDGGVLALMPNDRFAVTDVRNGEVRTYTTALDLVGTLRPQARTLRALAAGSDGSLAVLTGTPSCVTNDAEVDVYDGPTSEQPRARIRQNIGTAVGVAISADAVYVANIGCRGDGDGSIAVFGRDGTPHAVITNVGSPTGVLPFTPVRR